MKSKVENLNVERFAKCWALAKAGGTEGEREAGLAAATRVAAAAGLTIEEAERLVTEAGPTASSSSATTTSFWDDMIVREMAEMIRKKVDEEISRQMALREQRLKEEARERRRQAKAARLAHERDMEEWAARMKAEQAIKDREWAEQRRRQQENA
ncbi:hypothetical protein [Methylobacterium sp. WSM2598]|uniref:hypothetical protein n=1 Tax=Methylobacterium sp. WSM2598 TaxID=398261 RepID=UPI00036E7996|nr:hypothetical protein [Methylobacterium sp. WSM2598]